jgi:hypothetical protein
MGKKEAQRERSDNNKKSIRERGKLKHDDDLIFFQYFIPNRGRHTKNGSRTAFLYYFLSLASLFTARERERERSKKY